MRDVGVTTALLSDEPQVCRHPLADDFDELVDIDPPWEPRVAGNVARTHFGRCFVQMIDWLQSARGPFLLWCHLGGLGTTWDAPLQFRQAYQDQGDPDPPESAEVPERILPADYDPDELLGAVQSYAGQVTMLDECLDAFWDFFDGLPIARETLLSVTSARGFPLGEHNRLGPCDGELYNELVHVPWMLRPSGRRHSRAADSSFGRAGRPLGNIAGLVGCAHQLPSPVGRGARGEGFFSDGQQPNAASPPGN